MKILIVLSCALVATHAGYASPYYYNQHYPVIGPDGHPVETPEVQHAKAAHFAAHASARYGGYHAVPVTPYAPLAHNALPLDTPEVAAAKYQHFHDYAVAAQRNGVHVPVVGVHGHYPADTPEVQAAKAAHFAAHAAARSGHGHYRKRRALPYAFHYPVLDHNGVPVETPEVQAAKAHHFAEYNKIASRPGQNIPDTVDYNADASYGYHAQPVYQPQPYVGNDYYSHDSYRGPGGPPAQIGHDGQPIETHEVQAAKAAHFAAHAAVRAGQYGHYGR